VHSFILTAYGVVLVDSDLLVMMMFMHCSHYHSRVSRSI